MADDNTAAGVNALGALPTGTQNVAVGSQAGKNLTTGGQNVIIGYNGGPTLTTGSGNIVIGSGADVLASNTADYLNIGSAITGSLSTGAISLSASPPSTDNSTRIATTAYVTSALASSAPPGPYQMLYTGSVDTSSGTTNVINMCNITGFIGNYPVVINAYNKLVLRMYNIQSTAADSLTIYFMNKGTANVGNNYYSGQGISGPVALNQAPNSTWINSPSPAPEWTDGAGTVILQGFCFSNTAVTPSLWYELSTQYTGASAGACYASVSQGMVACNNVSTLSFDGLQFADGGSGKYTFDFKLYGIL